MERLRFTLVSEGPSDRVLLPVLQWLLRSHSTRVLVPQWADFRRLLQPPKGLLNKIKVALELNPCELLFVHRDADREPRETRVAEIERHLSGLPDQPAICVVPVRTQEAWFLCHEVAIRFAADNPNGRNPLSLPPLHKVEGIADPKQVLYEAIVEASGLRAGRRQRFSPEHRVYRIAELIQDYSALRSLPAFRALEADVEKIVAERGWS